MIKTTLSCDTKPKLLHLPLKIGNKPINALIDTAASENLIRPEAVPVNTRYESICTSVNGQTTAVTLACQLDTLIDGRIYKLRYLVYQDSRDMVVIGVGCLQNFGVSIDFARSSIELDGRMIGLTGMTCDRVDKTYYGQTDFDLWLPKRPAFFERYLSAIRRETAFESNDEIRRLYASSRYVHSEDGVYSIVKPNRRPHVYVPMTLRVEMIRNLHVILDGTHLSDEATWQSVRQHFYWPGMREDISRILRGCDVCHSVEGHLHGFFEIRTTLQGTFDSMIDRTEFVDIE